MRIQNLSVLCLLALAGCNVAPSATTKIVTTNDVVGVWSFTEDYGKTKVLMTFVPSGVFTQQIITATKTNIQIGTWRLSGSNLELTDFFLHDSADWWRGTMSWYFVDGKIRNVELIGGGFPDPDSFQHLKYIGAAQ